MLNRPLYEIQLDTLSKMGDHFAKHIEKLTDLDLMAQINNWLIYFEMRPFSFEEISMILKINDHRIIY